jgi:hypothetical protein
MRTLVPALLLSVSLQASLVYAEDVRVNENTESGDVAAPGAGGALFSISVDGERVAGTPVPRDGQRKADLALEHADIQVKFDGLDVKPILNVSTVPPKRSFAPGDTIDFLASNNYPAWISKAELRIFEDEARELVTPVTVVPVTASGAASWVFPANSKKRYLYVLRVYDEEGRWDETAPLSLAARQPGQQQSEPEGDAVAPGYGDDRTAIRNIPVFGGAVTVFGSDVPQGQLVTVMGELVPVDENGKFVVQRLLPPGEHNVDVALREGSATSNGVFFNREINIPENEWFYVALADFTLGKRFGDGEIEAADPGEFDDVYTKGRLAFYLKGKIKGRYLLTAAGDTGENSIKSMFKGLDRKDPKSFIRRIDPNDYYPVYGDDSTAVEDAPTRGKFYVKLQRGDSHVMWGNFKTEIRGTGLLRNERALYGASGVYKSEDTAASGERKTIVQVYAAQPGTLPQRDVLRGTGGSAYFLKHQDITVGSETLSIEVRDRITGRVLTRSELRFGHDYEIDFLQGIVLLKKPLPSTSSDGDLVRDGGLGGNPVFLIANYEFTPAAGDVDGYVYGGRAQQWLGNHVRVGVTGATEKTGAADQKMAGADVTLYKSERTFLEVEVARSKGPGFGKSTSADGGLTISDVATAGSRNRTADAVRVLGRASLEEFTDGAVKGDFEGYFEDYEGGFSSLDRQVTDRERKWGARADVEVHDSARVKLSYDEIKVDGGKRDRELAADVEVDLDENWRVATGVKNFKHQQLGDTRNGSRTDVGAKLSYMFTDDHSAYVFGQKTVERSGRIKRNDRVGAGILYPIAEKLDLGLEASTGTLGFGGLASLDYKPTADDHYYLGYRLDPDRENSDSYPEGLSGDDLGAIVAGVRHRYSERLSVFAEDNYDMFGDRRSLTQAYGVTYTPTSEWTFGVAAEIGDIIDDSVNAAGVKNSDFDRTALSLSAGYNPNDKVNVHAKAEARFEDSEDDTRDMTAYYLAAGVSYALHDDWRLLSNIDAVISDSSITQRDGDYVEGSLGFAYRPADDDRLNALFKYSFLYDLPGPDQVTTEGSTLGPAQRSHILSADVMYDVTDILSVGAKYGFRIGETKNRAPGSEWDDSSAHLGVLRADINVISNWDVLLEGRALWVSANDSVDFGALAAVYRHMGDNFKVGVGYNFGQFSDDLRDITADDHGVFINAVGQF